MRLSKRLLAPVIASVLLASPAVAGLTSPAPAPAPAPVDLSEPIRFLGVSICVGVSLSPLRCDVVLPAPTLADASRDLGLGAIPSPVPELWEGLRGIGQTLRAWGMDLGQRHLASGHEPGGS